MASRPRDVPAFLNDGAPRMRGSPEPANRTLAPGSFVRNSLSLMSGTVASQAIVFLLSPFLSRIFSPAEFGDLANYNAWVSILGLLSNLRYEHAVIVARNRTAMNRVMALSFALSVASVLLYGVIAISIFMFGPATGYLGAIKRIILFIPLGVLPAVVTSLLTLFSTRRGKFSRLAFIAVVQVVCTVVLQIVFGALGIEYGLILGALTGMLASCLILLALHLRSNRLHHVAREMSFARLAGTAREHANFPRYSLAADAINVVVQQFVPVFLTALFNPVVAGLYAFSTRVIRVPLFVVSTSVSTVLRKQAPDHMRREGGLSALFKGTATTLSLIAIGPFVGLWFFAPWLFAVVFGKSWVEAGSIVRILSPGIMLEFLTLPLMVFFIVTHSQRYSFRLQLLSVMLLLGALLVGRFYWNSFAATCMLISLAMVIANVVTIILAWGVANRTTTREASALA